jgi:hypothetical protein
MRICPYLKVSTILLNHLYLELGIEPDKIRAKFLAILTQTSIDKVAAEDDMAGTILVCVMFGILLMFRGKI